MGRPTIFLLTFFTYGSVHMMRTTYSFNKHTIAEKFDIGHLFLGIVDSIIFMSLALGTFLRYSILNDKKPTLTCLKTAIPTSIAFIIIPIISLAKGDEVDKEPDVLIHVIMAISFGLFGFFQLSFFPATLTLFSQYFNVKNDGIFVGIWSSKSNVGNILGFLLASLVVNEIAAPW
jgi:sugar phosphate permease